MIAVSCDICDTWETSCRRSHDTVRQRLTHAYCFVLDLSLSSSGWIWLLDTFFAQSDGSSKSSETRKDRRNGVAVQLVSPYCASKWQHFHLTYLWEGRYAQTFVWRRHWRAWKRGRQIGLDRAVRDGTTFDLPELRQFALQLREIWSWFQS
jgi:hypothetical protein